MLDWHKLEAPALEMKLIGRDFSAIKEAKSRPLASLPNQNPAICQLITKGQQV